MNPTHLRRVVRGAVEDSGCTDRAIREVLYALEAACDAESVIAQFEYVRSHDEKFEKVK